MGVSEIPGLFRASYANGQRILNRGPCSGKLMYRYFEKVVHPPPLGGS